MSARASSSASSSVSASHHASAHAAHASPSLTAADVARLRAALPPEAFRAEPRKLRAVALAAAVVVAAYGAAGRLGGGVPGAVGFAALIAVAALASSVIGFAAHDLAHGSIVRGGRAQRACELLFWSFLLVAPTVWRRVHNQTHHVHYGTADDPDRAFLAGEETTGARWYTWIFYPNAEVFPWNPLVFAHFIPYVVRNTLGGIFRGARPLGMPARPLYQSGDAPVILGELACIAVVQAALCALMGGQFGRFAVMALGVQVATSAISMSYIFTNHFINPTTTHADPLHGTTSVIVPAWLDRVHSNFSFHTEHHLFPTLNSDYYPQVSRLLAERFPESYRRIPIGEAWKKLWRNRPFAKRAAA
ncbi:MAG: hypothetical protein RLZZ15_3892 [Verrucomicrobiota bacterium]|jgi:fatty acid desaturase